MNVGGFLLNIFGSERFAYAVEALLRLALAGFFGGLIGYEREHSHRPAGLRTNILVSIGSALVMLTSGFIFTTYSGTVNVDPARLGAQVISGIGFLGAGTIIREGFSVKGLTTAASLWAVSCVGLAVGIGYYEGAIIATIFILITLNIVKRIMIRAYKGDVASIVVTDLYSAYEKIIEIVKDFGGSIQTMEILYSDRGASPILDKTDRVVLKAYILSDNRNVFRSISKAILALDEVEDIHNE